ncbi:hypothetical protein N7449_001980 [Penicillium cf. viridicatum]|uniref:Uncharacterized protein n=1 Tax=Penicillium cf. viridicatum TaxID=2972119 RepID=A0A9W9MU93_9EURO|nr:hypothetical protein N7449_001980 [Penicillium cf. viridicatum]
MIYSGLSGQCADPEDHGPSHSPAHLPHTHPLYSALTLGAQGDANQKRRHPPTHPGDTHRTIDRA